MSFETLPTIELVAWAALMIAVMSFTFATQARPRIRLAIIFSIWFAVVVVLGATGALGQQGVGAPGFGAVVALPLIALCVAMFTNPGMRAALIATPLPLIVAAHIPRLEGVTFVLLYAADRLPAPFAPLAGWGDMFAGVMAIPVAWLLWRRGAGARWLAYAWNAVGVIDLVTALALGATSQPGPLQLFKTTPDSSLMTTFPYVLIPCFLVPCLLSLHVAIFYRLNRLGAAARSATPNDKHRRDALAIG